MVIWDISGIQPQTNVKSTTHAVTTNQETGIKVNTLYSLYRILFYFIIVYTTFVLFLVKNCYYFKKSMTYHLPQIVYFNNWISVLNNQDEET